MVHSGRVVRQSAIFFVLAKQRIVIAALNCIPVLPVRAAHRVVPIRIADFDHVLESTAVRREVPVGQVGCPVINSRMLEVNIPIAGRDGCLTQQAIAHRHIAIAIFQRGPSRGLNAIQNRVAVTGGNREMLRVLIHQMHVAVLTMHSDVAELRLSRYGDDNSLIGIPRKDTNERCAVVGLANGQLAAPHRGREVLTIMPSCFHLELFTCFNRDVPSGQVGRNLGERPHRPHLFAGGVDFGLTITAKNDAAQPAVGDPDACQDGANNQEEQSCFHQFLHAAPPPSTGLCWNVILR